jgi:hypothetical protein
MTTTLRRPGTTSTTGEGPRAAAAPRPRAAAAPRRRAAAVLGAVALGAVALVAGAGAVVWQQVVDPEPFSVAVGTPVPADGLVLTVEDFGRRADATMGVNTAQQPLTGPAMPMGSGQVGTGGADTTGQGSTGAGSSMAGMPGMAGMLEHGQERVDVAVVVGNDDDGTEVLDPSRFVLYSDGAPVDLLAPTTTTLAQTPLADGARMAGNLTFVVPVGTTPLQLGYGDEPARVLLERAADAPAPADHDPAHDGADTP